MTKYLLAAACLALASCAAQKALPQYTEAEKAAQRGGISYWRPDSASLADTVPHTPRWAVKVPAPAVDSIIVERPASFLDKLLHRTPKLYHVAVTPARIGKKSTVNVYYKSTITNANKKAQVAVGDGAVASVVGKKAGPAVVASDSSTQNAILGAGNIQATNGNNNAPQLTAPVQQAADWRATLAKPAGGLLAGIGTVLIVGGCIYLIVAYRRGKKLTGNGQV